MNKMANNNLAIFDPETGITYNLILNEDDAIRANEDERFVNTLLKHAKCIDTREARENKVRDNHHQTSEASENEVRGNHHQTSEASENEVRGNHHQATDITKNIWQYDQVKDLIKSMSTHIDDLNHPKKRKEVFEHVANDLVSLHYEVNANMVQNKWNSLLKSYRKAKDIKNKTGRQPPRFNFFNLMDEVLGSNPTNSCTHAISSNDTQELQEIVSPGSSINISSSDQQKTKKPKLSEKKLKQEYIDLKKEEAQKRQARHEERLNMERDKLAVESKKLELLEKYLKTEE